MSQAYIDFSFVKENASFERVLAHYKLESRGGGVQRSVRCPFHPDHRPSCRVELDKKIFHCFACEASGNILEFVAQIDGHPRRPEVGGGENRRYLRDRARSAPQGHDEEEARGGWKSAARENSGCAGAGTEVGAAER